MAIFRYHMCEGLWLRGMPLHSTETGNLIIEFFSHSVTSDGNEVQLHTHTGTTMSSRHTYGEVLAGYIVEIEDDDDLWEVHVEHFEWNLGSIFVHFSDGEHSTEDRRVEDIRYVYRGLDRHIVCVLLDKDGRPVVKSDERVVESQTMHLGEAKRVSQEDKHANSIFSVAGLYDRSGKPYFLSARYLMLWKQNLRDSSDSSEDHFKLARTEDGRFFGQYRAGDEVTIPDRQWRKDEALKLFVKAFVEAHEPRSIFGENPISEEQRLWKRLHPPAVIDLWSIKRNKQDSQPTWRGLLNYIGNAVEESHGDRECRVDSKNKLIKKNK